MIELRYMTTRHANNRGERVCIDEVCARNANVHLEDLGDGWMLIVEKGDAIVHLTLPKSEYANGDAEVFESRGCKVTHDGQEQR